MDRLPTLVGGRSILPIPGAGAILRSVSDYILAKLIWAAFLVAFVFFGGIIYGLITGRDIRDLFRTPPPDRRPGSDDRG